MYTSPNKSQKSSTPYYNLSTDILYNFVTVVYPCIATHTVNSSISYLLIHEMELQTTEAVDEVEDILQVSNLVAYIINNGS